MAAQPEAVSQSTQSKYRKVRKSNDQPKIAENEVRITTSGRVKKYVDYALRLLEGGVSVQVPEAADTDDVQPADVEKPSRRFDTIILKATGRAINHAVTSAEVVKRRVGGLHQETKLETLEITDVWEPTEEGLKQVQTTRRVASITITLSKDVKQVDQSAAGYQSPIVAGFQSTAEFGKPMQRPYRGGGGRRDRGRGGPPQDRRRGDRPRRGGRPPRGGGRRRGDRNAPETGGRDNRPRSGGQRNDDYERGDRRGPRQQHQRSPRNGPRRGGPPPQQRGSYGDNQGYQGGGGRRRRGGRRGGGGYGGGHRSPQYGYQGGHPNQY